MTQEEIQEYNKMCAEFLGGIYSTYAEAWGFGNAYIQPNEIKFGDRTFKGAVFAERFEKELKFHSDWNWIMEVAEKIENKLSESFNVDICNKNQCEIVKNGEEFICGYGFETVNHSKKKAVVQAIYQFLKYYNENNK